MAVHGNQPVTQTEEDIGENNPQENQSTQSYDDRLAASLYEGYSSQNQIAIQVFLALAGAGVGYFIDVRDAYSFFAKNKIDANKLINNPEYREQIKRYADHLNFWEKGAISKGESKLGNVLDEANRAIKEVDETNKKIISVKEGVVKDYASELQNLYGLDRGEIDSIIQKAKYAVKTDPTISMQDFVQREAQSLARDRIKKEVENEAKANKEKLSPEEKKKRIQALTEEKKKTYYENNKTRILNDFERKFQNSLTNNCGIRLDKILTTPPPESVLFQPAAAAQPPVTPSPPPVTPPPTIPASAFPKISVLPSFSLPKFSLPSFSLPYGLPFGNFLKGAPGFIARRGLGRFINLAGNLGKRVLNRTLDAFMPGLGTLVGKINDAIKNFTGIDIEKTILMGAAVLVVIVAGIIVIIPIIGLGMFAANTGSNPQIVTSNASLNKKTISWVEFDKEYLDINSNNQINILGKGATNQLTWYQFEVENLTPQKSYLSLDVH